MNFTILNKTLDLTKRVFDKNTATDPIIPFVAQKPKCPTGKVVNPLPRCMPEKEGISSRYIASFLRELKDDKSIDMHDVIIIRNGKILCECAFGLQDLTVWKTTFSACKSITSLAIGMLVDDGLLSVTDKMSRLFDDKMQPLSYVTMKDLTVRDVLTMTSGVVFNEATCMTETDWSKGFMNSIVIGEMSKTFNYNSLNTYMLAVLVKRLTGKTMSEFLSERLFTPLGITEYFWEKSPEGVEKGGWGLYIKPEDEAKIGIMILQKGVWNGTRIVSEKWIEDATARQVQAPKDYGVFDYGYQIWSGRYENSFLFNGMLGQNLLGFKDSGILIVSNAGNEELFQQSNYFNIVRKYFAKSFGFSIDEDLSGYEDMLRTVRSMSYYPQCHHRRTFRDLFTKKSAELPQEHVLTLNRIWKTQSSGFSVGLMPVLWQMVTNNYTKGLKSISFAVADGTYYMNYRENDCSFSVPVGLSAPERFSLTFHGETYECASIGTFSKDEDGNTVLKVNIAFLEIPCTRKIKIYFKPDHILYKSVESPGADFIVQNVLERKQAAKGNKMIAPFLSRLEDDYLEYKIRSVFEPEIKLF